VSDSESTRVAAQLSPQAAADFARIDSSARWFWWIAGLSLINTVMTLSGSQTSFVMGLGFTLVSDAIFAGNHAVALVIDALALGFFVLMGVMALRHKLWAFYLGTAMYVLDAVIYVLAGDWVPVAFHGLAVYFIALGAMKLIAMRREAGAPAPIAAESAEPNAQ